MYRFLLMGENLRLFTIIAQIVTSEARKYTIKILTKYIKMKIYLNKAIQ